MAVRSYPLKGRNALVMAQPEGARVFDIIFTIISAGVCLAFLIQRIRAIKNWRGLIYLQWSVLLQFALSFCFVIVTAVLRYGYDANTNMIICRGGIIVCITLYSLIKLFYMFLADRLHIVRTSGGRRTKSILNVFHHAAIIAVVIAWNTASFMNQMIAYINDEQVCIIGISRPLAYSVTIADIILNLYLTAFFLYCLSTSFQFSTTVNKLRRLSGRPTLPVNATARPLSANLRNLAIRTLVGLGITLVATLVNMVLLVIMDGEVMWFCFIMCKADVLIGVCVLFWITRGDRNNNGTTARDGSSQQRTALSASRAGRGAGGASLALSSARKPAAAGSPIDEIELIDNDEEEEEMKETESSITPIVIHGREVDLGDRSARESEDDDGGKVDFLGGPDLLFRTETCPKGEKL